MTDIVEKPPCKCLEKVDGRWTNRRCNCSGENATTALLWCINASHADTITRLTAEVERLRAVVTDAIEIVGAIHIDKEDDEVLADLLDDLRAALSPPAQEPAYSNSESGEVVLVYDEEPRT